MLAKECDVKIVQIKLGGLDGNIIVKEDFK